MARQQNLKDVKYLGNGQEAWSITCTGVQCPQMMGMGMSYWKSGYRLLITCTISTMVMVKPTKSVVMNVYKIENG